MKLSAMKMDPALTEQGDWAENIPDLLGIRIKARGTNNSDYRALEAKLVFLAYRGSPLLAGVHARRPDGN